MFLANFNNTDPTRPSFFEMLAQQEMVPVLRPAVTYLFDVTNDICHFILIFQVLAQRSSRLSILSRFADEVFSIGLLVLENHYLFNYGMFTDLFQCDIS